METEKLLLTAGILNAEREVEIYDWLALIAPEYTSKLFNKRFETWLNKKSGERFGTHERQFWGNDGQTVTYPDVLFSLNKSFYISEQKFELSINYTGKTVQYDYDTKTKDIRDHNENEKIFGLTGVNDIVDQAKNVAMHRRNEIEKMQGNLKYLPKLMAQRDRLKAEIEEHNEKISYVISDSVRIKR